MGEGRAMREESDPVMTLREERVARRAAEPKARGGGFAGWLLFLLALGLGAAFYHFVYEPLAREGAQRGRALSASERRVAELEGRLAALGEQRAALAGERDALRSERDRLAEDRGRLSSTVQAREAEIARLEAAQRSLTERMGEEIRRGDILVQNENGELKVKLADQILFASGEAELSPRGQAVLRRVAESLASLEDHVIEVGGHTDSLPLSPRIAERFATNWELSTARATNVVRFLSDECAVPGERLAATGYSHFRPVASNGSSAGRRRNRRIELTLRPRAVSGASAEAPAAAE
jgi:chemotaxis protein MotB